MSSDILIKMPATAHSILIVPGMPVLGRWQFQFPNNRGDLRVLPQMACTIPAKCPQASVLYCHYGRTTTADFFLWDPNPKTLLEVLLYFWEQRKYLLHEFAILPDQLQAFITPLDETTAEPGVKPIRDEFRTRIGKRTV